MTAERWKVISKKGRLNYIFRYGFLLFGGSISLFYAVIRFYFYNFSLRNLDKKQLIAEIVTIFIILPLLGAFFGNKNWKINQNKFSENNKQMC